jgi:hypothetical protein
MQTTIIKSTKELVYNAVNGNKGIIFREVEQFTTQPNYFMSKVIDKALVTINGEETFEPIAVREVILPIAEINQLFTSIGESILYTDNLHEKLSELIQESLYIITTTDGAYQSTAQDWKKV